jgi:hypothetical protein
MFTPLVIYKMFKRLIVKILIFVNLFEGIIHLIVSAISFWGMYDMNIWDWRIAAAPTTDFFLGVASLITSYFLNSFEEFHHHN